MTSIALAQTDPAAAQSQTIKVAVVDDSAVVRGLVSRWIDEEPQLEVCGRYSNGHLALEGVLRDVPDIIVLDIEMPVMDGLTALPGLLERAPGAKVIVASTLSRKNAETTLRALSLGASDYIPKPESNSGITTSLEFRGELLRKIKAVGRHKKAMAQATAPVAPAAGRAPEPHAFPAATPAHAFRAFSSVKPQVLAIGSSTGGPQALARVIEDIVPAIASVPIVICQHMPATFTTILAQRLGQSAGVPAKEGDDGDVLFPGHIYVARGGKHMALALDGGTPVIRVYDGPPVNYCKPSVDPLFESVAAIYGSASLALVLTGMGHDGAEGGHIIADAGGSVIAQDQETSVVWGMPGAVFAAGACAAVLPLGEIGPKLNSLLSGGPR